MSAVTLAVASSTGIAAEQGDALTIKSQRQTAPKWIEGGLAYPDNLLSFRNASGWFFMGGTKGNGGGFKVVPAPERPGQQALMMTAKMNPNSGEWLAWMHGLDPLIRVDEMKEIVFDIYQLDPINFDMTVRCGTQQGLGLIPISWSQIPNGPLNKWREVRIPVYPTRRSIDNLKIDFFAGEKGIKDGQQVRIIVSNWRFEPAPKPWTEEPMEKLFAADGSLVGMSVVRTREILDDATLKMEYEITGLVPNSTYTVQLNAAYPDGTSQQWRADSTYQAPCTLGSMELKGLRTSPPGEVKLTMEVLRSDGRSQMATRQALPIRTYSTQTFEKNLAALAARHHTIQVQANEMKKAGKDVAEPLITLFTAWHFIERFIPDDFNRQKAYGIAMREIELVNRLLDEAQVVLAKPAKPAVNDEDYDPSLPVVARDGWLYQKDRPIMLIGGLTWGDGETGSGQHAISMARDIGFNSVVVEIGMADWLDNPHPEPVLQQYVDMTRKERLAANLLLSGHYRTKRAVGHEGTTHVGMPWNVLNPQTNELFSEFYQKAFKIVGDSKHIVAYGTANEPDYAVRKGALYFGEAFGKAMREKHGTIATANKLWSTNFESFDTMTAGDIDAASEKSIALNREWQSFVQEKVADFFAGRREEIHRHNPDALVWTKLIGRPGYGYLDEELSLERGQTVSGCDGQWPIWLDMLKSIRPEWPVANTEWHHSDPKHVENPLPHDNEMFLTVVHGIAMGEVWLWTRGDWSTQLDGSAQSMTRYPIVMDAAGRSALKFRRNAAAFAAISNVKGGRARMYFNKYSQLGKVDQYDKDQRVAYDYFGRNTSGVRFLTSKTLASASLDGLELIATADLNAVDQPQLDKLMNWVRNGGTLWVINAGKPTDFYTRETNVDAQIAAALQKEGSHDIGKGHILVGRDQQPDLRFFDGPFALNEDGTVNRNIEIRLARQGDSFWMSLINTSDKPQTFHYSTVPAAECDDPWNHETVNLNGTQTLIPWQVRLLRPAAAK